MGGLTNVGGLRYFVRLSGDVGEVPLSGGLEGKIWSLLLVPHQESLELVSHLLRKKGGLAVGGWDLGIVIVCSQKKRCRDLVLHAVCCIGSRLMIEPLRTKRSGECETLTPYSQRDEKIS